jgi:hypothetical protein
LAKSGQRAGKVLKNGKFFSGPAALFLDFRIFLKMRATKSININKSNREFPCPVPEGRETGRIFWDIPQVRKNKQKRFSKYF